MLFKVWETIISVVSVKLYDDLDTIHFYFSYKDIIVIYLNLFSLKLLLIDKFKKAESIHIIGA